MQPTSILFQQAAEAGLSHQALLRYLVSVACQRAGLPAVPTPFADNPDDTIFAKLPEGKVRTCRGSGSVNSACPLPPCHA
jgi:hypothetical protein